MLRPWLLLGYLLLLAGCGGSPGSVAADAAASTPAGDDDDAFFRLVVDGAAIPISNDDVLVSSQPDGSLRIYAGPDGGSSVMLTIPEIAACPCSVPAGAIEPTSLLNQGAVSLQNHPERGNVLNSWYLGQTGAPASDAIRITDIGSLRDGVRFIGGRVHVTVLRSESNGDGPGNRDTAVEAEFRVRHAPHGGAF